MPQNSFRQIHRTTRTSDGLRHISSVLLQHKKLTVVSLIAIIIAAIPIASEVFAEGDEPSRQNQQVVSSQQLNQSQELSDQKDEIKQPAAAKEDQSMQSDVRIDSNNSSAGASSSDVDVTVNGQNIPVPQNGSVHKRMTDSSGESVVDIQVDNQSGTHNSSSSSTVIIEQHSYSTGNETQNSGGNSRHPDRR